jgi:hypothetical protein
VTNPNLDRVKLSLLALLVACVSICRAQSVLDLPLKGSERGKPLSFVIDSLEKKHSVHFFYLPEWIKTISLPDETKGFTLRAALDEILQGQELSYTEMYPGTIVIFKDPTLSILRQSAIVGATRDQKKIVKYTFGSAGQPKQRVTISGTIKDSQSGDPLSGATIFLSDSTSTTANADGRFSLRIPSGEYLMTIGFVNYDEMVIDLAAFADGTIDAKLEEVPTVLQEVIVQDRTQREIIQSRLGQTYISIAELKRSPAMLGETDLVKQMQTLPGVTTVGEAASGFNVRGGSVDQNLVLYDGMPIYNSSHAFGFLSAFNSHTIRDVSFYRGGIPAEYGGRASSVLDIRAAEGNMERWNGNAGIGIIAMHMAINGPIVRDKTSIATSFRSTYSDWLVNSIKTAYADLSKSNVGFYDATLKLTHLFTPNTKLSVTGYASNDSFRLTGDSTYQWFNRVLSARFDHRFSESLNLEATAGVSSYSYNINNRNPETAFNLSYRITTPLVKLGLYYENGRHKATIGVQMQYYDFDPGSIVPKGNSNKKEKHMPRQYSFENAAYINDIFTISERLTAEGGVRLPFFTSFDVNREPDITYVGVEPRGALRFTTGPTSSIKAGYTRMYQYLHLITNTAAVTPVDIWQPSNANFKPQRADQLSLGYFRNFKERKYEASVEGFYKSTENILDFRNGANLILNDNLQRDLLRGSAVAYGVEASAGITSGRLTGNLNYTYSRSLRQVIGPTTDESINNGEKYPSNFDQPHVANASWRYAFTRRYSITGNFTYHTGRPISIPLSGYYFEGKPIADFSDRNQSRISDYHRLDLAFVVEGNHKRKKLGDGTWVFSLYNVYSRKNAYSVFYRPTATGQLRAYQLSIIGTVLPSISYNFTF